MPDSPPDVSVVVTYYNREQFIDETLESVFRQTLPPLEILLVNDCSKASSREHVEKYRDRVTIVDLPRNVGGPAARNEGIRRAAGRFICILDDDDIWFPEKLAVQRRWMEEHPETAMLQSAAWAFHPGRPDQLWAGDRPSPLDLPRALMATHVFIPSTLMARADALRAVGGFDSSFRFYEDWDLQIRVAASGYRFESIPKPLIRYRRQGEGALTNKWTSFLLGDARLFWKHHSLYHKVYGFRAGLSTLAASLRKAGTTPTVFGRFFRVAARLIGEKWVVKERKP